jgi:hypothetical protein
MKFETEREEMAKLRIRIHGHELHLEDNLVHTIFNMADRQPVRIPRCRWISNIDAMGSVPKEKKPETRNGIVTTLAASCVRCCRFNTAVLLATYPFGLIEMLVLKICLEPRSKESTRTKKSKKK